ncbi:MAG: hypothetical protein MUD03_16450 [Pirellula sp.]|jgi:hypothetical protein|nr:hypothetical protein [Pirellula sp.]
MQSTPLSLLSLNTLVWQEEFHAIAKPAQAPERLRTTVLVLIARRGEAWIMLQLPICSLDQSRDPQVEFIDGFRDTRINSGRAEMSATEVADNILA